MFGVATELEILGAEQVLGEAGGAVERVEALRGRIISERKNLLQ